MCGLQNGQDREEVIKELACNLESKLANRSTGVGLDNTKMWLSINSIASKYLLSTQQRQVILSYSNDTLQYTVCGTQKTTINNIKKPTIQLVPDYKQRTCTIILAGEVNGRQCKMTIPVNIPFCPKKPSLRHQDKILVSYNGNPRYVFMNTLTLLAPTPAVTQINNQVSIVPVNNMTNGINNNIASNVNNIANNVSNLNNVANNMINANPQTTKDANKINLESYNTGYGNNQQIPTIQADYSNGINYINLDSLGLELHKDTDNNSYIVKFAGGQPIELKEEPQLCFYRSDDGYELQIATLDADDNVTLIRQIAKITNLNRDNNDKINIVYKNTTQTTTPILFDPSNNKARCKYIRLEDIFLQSQINTMINNNRINQIAAENPEQKQIRIIIQHNKNDNFPRQEMTIDAPESTTVRQLREEIKRKYGLQSNEYNFVFNSPNNGQISLSFYDDDRTIENIGITDNCTIDIVDKQQSIVPATQSSANGNNQLKNLIKLDKVLTHSQPIDTRKISMLMHPINEEGDIVDVPKAITAQNLLYTINEPRDKEKHGWTIGIASGDSVYENKRVKFSIAVPIENLEPPQAGQDNIVKFTILCNGERTTLELPFETKTWKYLTNDTQSQFIEFCRNACQRQNIKYNIDNNLEEKNKQLKGLNNN